MKTAYEMRKYADESYDRMKEDAKAWAERVIKETISPAVEEIAYKGCYSALMKFEASKMNEFHKFALCKILLELGYEVDFNFATESIEISW